MTVRDDRFRPSRAGVINVWDYADEEFAFADGRLVLRGHNGSGKTKALEVLFPFVLDGVADARRLDPFSGENRTMKSNLLYRGQEAEYGYVWMEFARGYGHAAETVTLIIGMRAHRHRDGVRTSFFVTGKRLGIDFGLLGPDSRPLTDRQLKTVLEPDSHAKTATEYRDLVDARLFGLGRERYTQLLDLLLALRRPLLAKDLDPSKVSDTLTSGLSPVDEDLVDQAARDFENLSAVQKQFDDFAAADKAVRAFLDDYRDYLRTYARARLERIQAETVLAADHARTIARAGIELERAERAHETAEQARAMAEAERDTLQTRLGALQKHEAYQAQEAIELQRRQIAATAAEIAQERARVGRGEQTLEQLQDEVDKIADRLEQALSAFERHAGELTEAAERAGIEHDPASIDAGPERGGVKTDLLRQVNARIVERRDDVEVVRQRLRLVSEAERERGRAEAALERAAQTVDQRETKLENAELKVAAARRSVLTEVRQWAGTWAEDRPDSEAAGPGEPAGSGEPAGPAGRRPEPIVGDGDVEALTDAVERAGEPDAPSPAEVFAERSRERWQRTTAQVERLAARLERVTGELTEVRARRAEVAQERDDAPGDDPLRSAGRDGRPGAPLWRLVRFPDTEMSDDLLDSVRAAEGRAAAIEGALHAAGLLTAWVHPDAEFTAEAVRDGHADGYLVALPEHRRPSGLTLADVLLPEDQDLVPPDVIMAILRSVALVDDLMVDPLKACTASAITVRAQYVQGVLRGAGPKAAPEFIGATNRANRRKARLAELDARICDLGTTADELTADLEAARRALGDFDRARAALPRTSGIQESVRQVAHWSTLLAEARGAHDERRKELDTAVAEVDAKRRELRRIAAERSMPSLPDEIDQVSGAIDEYAKLAERLEADRRQARAAERDLTDRQSLLTRQRAEHEEAAHALESKEKAHNAAMEEFRVRESALDAPLQEVLAEIGETERRLKAVAAEFRRLGDAVTREHDAIVNAQADLRHGRSALELALRTMLEQAASFAPYAHPDLRPLLGVTVATPWPAGADWADPARAAEAVVNALAVPDGTGETTGAGAGAGAGEGTGVRDAATDPSDAVRAALPGGVAGLLDAYRAELTAGAKAATGGRAAVGENAMKNANARMSAALRAFQEALDGCAEDYRLDYDRTGTVVMVFVLDEGGRSPVTAFARRIADRVAEQGVLLEDRERTVLEDSLLTNLALQIHARVGAARELVQGMNRDTRSRPMSSGTAIGIRWGRSDKISDRQRSAASLLERDAKDLGRSGLAELRRLLREMIRDYRAAHPRATYRQALAEVLDYRTWYTFELRLAVPGAPEVRLTKAKHSEMSGGEKSASIHLPLFAAANALYSSAKPTCPRMIALDEAFAGIDDMYKPELLGLTVTFDLDLFMTGHDLWVHYDTVPMAAHYDMHHDKAAHAVSAMLLLWDGAQTIDADAGFAGNAELAESLLGIPPRRHVPADLENTLLTELSDDEADDEPGAA